MCIENALIWIYHSRSEPKKWLYIFTVLLFHLNNTSRKKRISKVEKNLKGSLDLFSSPSPSIQIMGRKVCLRCKGKHCWALSTNFSKQKFCWHHPAMFCLINSSKLSSLWFQFSIKVKVMRSNPGYLLKSFLL